METPGFHPEESMTCVFAIDEVFAIWFPTSGALVVNPEERFPFLVAFSEISLPLFGWRMMMMKVVVYLSNGKPNQEEERTPPD